MTIKISKYTSTPVYIHGCGFNSALGSSREEIHQRLRDGSFPQVQPVSGWLNNGTDTVVGKVAGELPAIPESLKPYNTYNNRLALSALAQVAEPIRQAIAKYGRDRVAVIVGTSTSGTSDTEAALLENIKSGELPGHYHYSVHEANDLGEFVAAYFDLQGPVYTISTACSSSGRVFMSARRLLKAGIVDAVVVGGCDSFCQLTLNGFSGLEAMSDTFCNPFSENRKGINLGEAAAFMLLSLTVEDSARTGDVPAVALLGVGDSSDAHHISAPHPEGKGAEVAMRRALDDAGLKPESIGYINAHGTSTPLNDAMESKAINRVFGEHTPVSSTKPLTGHTLGAASAVEAAICWHVLRYQLALPAQVNDGQIDQSLAPVALVQPGTQLVETAILSNSFAFGGNNISLIFGYAHG